jgi:hypothetical protein
LSECDDSVLLTKHVMQHREWTLAGVIGFRPLVISVL